MKRFKKGAYHVGGLIATTLIESTVFGTICEFDRDSSLYPNGMYRIELLNGSGENRWIDADAVWSLDEIRRRKAYLEKLDKLIATFKSGSIIWELLMQEKRNVEQIAPPEDMEETLEKAEKERRSTPDGC